MQRLIFLGGNGHSTERLTPARATLNNLTSTRTITAFQLLEAKYPGFEDRPRAADWESFLTETGRSIAGGSGSQGTTLLYGTGIGGLLALCLRARGEFLDVPLLLQAPVLWGLESRWMPRLMRVGLAHVLLLRLFAWPWFQRRFVRKQFERPPNQETQAAFFAGYAHCPAAPDLFHWLTPSLLRALEQQFATRPETLGHIGIWWGGRDRVVSLQELAWTEQALHVHWPVRMFPDWGHYPMIDEPEQWVRALADVVATPDAIPGPVHPEAP
jgi:pimeloyl-ACP methyl ester carboxylesterase